MYVSWLCSIARVEEKNDMVHLSILPASLTYRFSMMTLYLMDVLHGASRSVTPWLAS